MRFIEEAKRVKSIVIMIQEEVADRLTAKAGSVEYGAITAGIDAFANCKKIFRGTRQNFYPVPNVDSAVVKIDIQPNKYEILSRTGYRKLVRTAFSMRRKTLVNNLMQSSFINQICISLIFKISK